MAERAGVAIAAALAPVTFLAVDPWGWYPFGPLRWLLLSVLVLAAGALVLGRGPLPTTARPALVVAGALVVVLALAAIVGRDPLYAWTGTPERHAGVVLWLLALVALAVGASLDGSGRGAVRRGLVVAGIGVGVVGWAEALGWEPDELAVGSRLTGTFGSSAFLGAAVALLLPAVVGVALDRAGPVRWRWAAAVGGVALVVPAVGSGARSAWLGLLAAAVAVAVAHRRSIRPRTVLAAVALVAVVLVASPAGSRLADLGDDDAPGGRGRIDEWRVAARVIADHPVLGVGPEGYRIAFAEGVDEEYEIAHGRDPQPDRAHSAPLDIALAGGIPALVAWGAVVVLVGRVAVRALVRGSPSEAGVAAALIAHLVGQLALFPLAEVEPITWLLAGTLLADPIAPPTDERHGVGLTHSVTLGVLAVVALVAGGLDVAADHRAERAAQALAAEDGRTARAEAEAAVALRPDVVRLRLLTARAAIAADEGILAALDEVEAARRISPGDPIVGRERIRLLVARAAATQVPAHARSARRAADAATADDPVDAALWLLAGEAARLDGDPAAAREAWERAEHLAPDDPDPPVELALLHHAAGRNAEAEAALARAQEIDPDDPRVREAAALITGR